MPLDHCTCHISQNARWQCIKFDGSTDKPNGVAIAVAFGRSGGQLVALDLRRRQRHAFDVGRRTIKSRAHLVQAPLDGLWNKHAGRIVVAKLIDVGLFVMFGCTSDRPR